MVSGRSTWLPLRAYHLAADGDKKPKGEEMLRLKRRCIMAALALVAACPLTPATAQSYPTRPMTIIVPLAAGTGMDTVVRLYGDELSKSLGQSVVVDNRPGAATMIGTD